MFCDFVVVTTVSNRTDENMLISAFLIPRNSHNQRKYWIAIKVNFFRGRACSPWLPPPKATSIQWGYSLKGKVTFPIAYTKCKQIVALHYGNEYMDVKIGNHTLDGFSLDVGNNASGGDAHWIAVGA